MSDRTEYVPLQVNPYSGTDVNERRLLGSLDGFNDMPTIVVQTGMSMSKVSAIVEKLREDGIVCYLNDWTLLHWCEICDLPLMSQLCSLCGAVSRSRITLRPPSNPKVIDRFYINALRSVGIATSGNMVINAFKQSGAQKFELIRRRKLAELAFDEVTQCWRLESDSGVTRGHTYTTEIDRHDALQRILRANSARLTALENKAIKVMRSELSKTAGTIPVFHHSGGKDSVVAFDLLIRVQRGAINNPINVMSYELGIDFPETQACVRNDIARYPGQVRFYYYSHKEVFLKTMRKIGPPALGNIWCCPQSGVQAQKILRDLYAENSYVSIKGHRKRESIEKMLWAPEDAIYVQRRAFLNEQALNPIWSWCDFDVWLYIHKHRLKYHPIYDTGVQRLVCATCPIHSDSEQQLINERNPELIRDFDEPLRQWKEKLGLPEEWITRRIWRTANGEAAVANGASFKSNAAQIAALLEHVSFGELIKENESESMDGSGWVARGVIRTQVSLLGLMKYLRVIVGNVTDESDGLLRCGDVRITVDKENTVAVVGASEAVVRKIAIRVGELINVYINCIGCRFCEEKCGCLVVVDGRVQAGEKAEGGCSKCRSFMNVCPVNRSKYVNFSHLFSGFRGSSESSAASGKY